MKRVTYVPRIVVPRHEGGVDHGAPGLTLIRSGEGVARKELRWMSGSTGWVSLGETGYFAATLDLVESRWGRWEALGVPIHTGGRLSLKVLLQYRDRLHEVFEYPFSKADFEPIVRRNGPQTLVLKP